MSEEPKKKVVKVVKAQPKKVAKERVVRSEEPEKWVYERPVKEEPPVKEPELLVYEEPEKEEITVQEPVPEAAKPKKTPVLKKWWFWLIFAGLVLALIALLTQDGNSSKEPAEKVYISDNQIIEMYSNPDQFKGQYVKLAGKVFTTPEQKDGVYGFQMWQDPENAERNTLIYTSDTSLDLHEDDYIFVDGKIDGTFSGENMLGGTVTAPIIADAVVTKSNYIDVVVPTLKEFSPNLTQDQRGFNVTVEKIEYAATQTRVYVTIRNNTSDQMSYSAYDIKMLVDGQQVEQKDDYDAELPELSYEILPGASTSGVLIFPAVDQNKAFQLVIPGIYSDNWDLDYEFKDMTFDIQPT